VDLAIGIDLYVDVIVVTLDVVMAAVTVVVLTVVLTVVLVNTLVVVVIGIAVDFAIVLTVTLAIVLAVEDAISIAIDVTTVQDVALVAIFWVGVGIALGSTVAVVIAIIGAVARVLVIPIAVTVVVDVDVAVNIAFAAVLYTFSAFAITITIVLVIVALVVGVGIAIVIGVVIIASILGGAPLFPSASLALVSTYVFVVLSNLCCVSDFLTGSCFWICDWVWDVGCVPISHNPLFPEDADETVDFFSGTFCGLLFCRCRNAAWTTFVQAVVDNLDEFHFHMIPVLVVFFSQVRNCFPSCLCDNRFFLCEHLTSQAVYFSASVFYFIKLDLNLLCVRNNQS
jgi:hypothetical protein